MSRTTLTLDDDVLDAARAIADRDRRTIGDVVSDLMRKALARPHSRVRTRNGLPLLVRDTPPDAPITLDLVNRLRDEEE